MKNFFHLLLMMLVSSQFSFASENPPEDTTTQKHYTTQRLKVPPIIDGTFDDACWDELNGVVILSLERQKKVKHH